MIKKVIDAVLEYWKGITAIAAICTTIFSYAALRVNNIKNRAVDEYTREQEEIRKDTTIVFLSRGFVQINSRLQNIEGLIKMQSDVANTHTEDLKSIRSSLTRHYLRDQTLTKKDLVDALNELDAKKRKDEALIWDNYEPKISITPIKK